MKFRNKTYKINLKEREKVKIHNHFRNSFIIGNKKALFQIMNSYYSSINENVFDYLPLTFHICNGLEDEQFHKFLQYYENIEEENSEKTNKFNAWILKPGEKTNRGQGITVCLNL